MVLIAVAEGSAGGTFVATSGVGPGTIVITVAWGTPTGGAVVGEELDETTEQAVMSRIPIMRNTSLLILLRLVSLLAVCMITPS
jgi:hypothetical protein